MEDTIGVTKAKDLISGKVYEDKNGIKVEVAPRGAVLLEILETAETVAVGAVYEADGKILDSDTKTALKGEKILFEAPIIDGYSLTDGQNESARFQQYRMKIQYFYINLMVCRNLRLKTEK